MKKTVGLREVAQRAGVSLGTASKIVNNTGNVNDKMRKKVLQAVKDLNYVPNVFARSLKTNLTFTIGVIIPEISNSFFDEVVGGIQDFFEPEGYSVLIYNTRLNSKKEIEAFDMFNQKVDGIIFVSNTINDELFEVLKNISIPIVLVSTYAQGFVSININNEQAAFSAVDLLCKQGHTKIALLSGDPEDLNAGYPRLKGYMRALSENNIQIRTEFIRYGKYRFEDGVRNTLELLAQKDRPDAIFAASDTMAVGALHVLQAGGHKIPTDISIIGFDDIAIARYASPALSTVRQPRYKMGSEGARKLSLLMRQEEIEIKNYIFDFELVIRASTKL